MPSKIAGSALCPKLRVFCAPATANSPSPIASKKRTGCRRRRNGADAHVAYDSATAGHHEGDGYDAEQVKPPLARSDGPADGEYECANQIEDKVHGV
jgi:hypothetical protein